MEGVLFGEKVYYYRKTILQPVLRIRDVYSGYEFFLPGSRLKKIPDPRSASASKNKFKFLNSKTVSKLWEQLSGMFIPDPGSGSATVFARVWDFSVVKDVDEILDLTHLLFPRGKRRKILVQNEVWFGTDLPKLSTRCIMTPPMCRSPRTRRVLSTWSEKDR